MEGWLLKRYPCQGGWFPRYCVFNGEELVCYADETKESKKNVVVVSASTVAIPFKDRSAPGESASLRHEKPFGFVLDPTPEAGKGRRLHYFDVLRKEGVGECSTYEWIEKLSARSLETTPTCTMPNEFTLSELDRAVGKLKTALRRKHTLAMRPAYEALQSVLRIVDNEIRQYKTWMIPEESRSMAVLGLRRSVPQQPDRKDAETVSLETDVVSQFIQTFCPPSFGAWSQAAESASIDESKADNGYTEDKETQFKSQELNWRRQMTSQLGVMQTARTSHRKSKETLDSQRSVQQLAESAPMDEVCKPCGGLGKILPLAANGKGPCKGGRYGGCSVCVDMSYQDAPCSSKCWGIKVCQACHGKGRQRKIRIGDFVVVTSDEEKLRRSFFSIPYFWDEAMRSIVGTSQQVQDVRENGNIIGLMEAVPKSGYPIWYYSASTLSLES